MRYENSVESFPSGGSVLNPVKLSNMMRIQAIRRAHTSGVGGTFFVKDPQNMYTLIFSQKAGERSLGAIFRLD